MSTLFILALVSSAFVTGEARSVASSYSDELSQGNSVAVKKATAAKTIRRKPQNPTGTNMNTCLFSSWTNVITTPPSCSGAQLCYGPSGDNTKFAVCFDTKRRIPKYAAYVMERKAGTGRSDKWTIDATVPAENQANLQSYNRTAQMAKYGGPPHNWDEKGYFLSKGHLTPNLAFQERRDRDLTFVFTNAAPQWQKFNSGNWQKLEEAIQKYADKVKRGVYVLTGVNETFRDRRETNPLPNPLRMNEDPVDVPKYFWTIVCDPNAGQHTGESIAFIAKNNVGDMDTTKKHGCNSEAMSSQNGVIDCMSVADFRKEYSGITLPTFHSKCQDDKRGTFLDSCYAGKFH